MIRTASILNISVTSLNPLKQAFILTQIKDVIQGHGRFGLNPLKQGFRFDADGAYPILDFAGLS